MIGRPWRTFTSVLTHNRETEGEPKGPDDEPWSSLPEVAVGVYDPHSEALHPLLLSSDAFMAAKHAQGEFVDAWLQQGPKVPVEVAGLVLVVVTLLLSHIAVKQAIGVRRVVVVVSPDQGEERLRHVAPLVCLWGRRRRRGRPLGAAPPPGEAEAAPASVPGCLGFVSRALVDASAPFGAPTRAGHF